MKLPPRVLKTKIGRRLLIVFLAISLLPLAALGWIAIKRAEAEIHRQTLHVLQAATDGAEAQLREFLEHLKSRTVGLSLDGVLRDNLETVLSGRGSTTSQAQAVTELQMSLAQRTQRFPDRQEIFIMNLDGRTISSSRPESAGRNYANNDFFKKGQEAVFVSDVFPDPITGKPTWIIAAPVHGRISGKLMGVLADRIDPSLLTDLTTGRRVTRMGADTQSFRIGETGETYIVNRDKLMITESRFVPEAVLRIKVDTEPVDHGLSEGKEFTGDYRDYRRRPVSGASTLIPETGWVMLTEIDFTQAFAPLKRLERALLLLTAGLIFPLGFLAWRFTRKIVTPLEALNEAEAALIAEPQGHGAQIFVPERNIPHDEIGDMIHRRNERVRALIEQQARLAEEQEHRSELLGKMLQESLTFSRTLFWRTPLPPPGGSFFKTWAQAEIYGSLDEVLGFPLSAFRKNPALLQDQMHPDDFRRIEELVAPLRSEGSAVRHICRFRHSKGQWISVHVQISVARSDRDDELILQGIGTDVTEMMQVQTELQRAQGQLRNYAASLEHEVGERTAKLQETVRSLEGVCYHLVHDLRAPLRAMQGFTSLLLQEYGGRMDARGENYAQRVCDSAARMDRLITDLLEFGNIGHMPLRISEVSLADALESAQEELKKAIRATEAEVKIEGPLPKVLGNAAVLQKVFRHLLSNALTFTANGIAPRIKIWTEQTDNLVRVFVKDNGIGIPEEYRDRIFGIFERLHSDQSYPGTGIGLAIVSKAVERMDGHVGFESRPGKGSTFWVELRRVP